MRQQRRQAWVRKAGLFGMDMLLVLLAVALAMAFRFAPDLPQAQVELMAGYLPWVMLCYAAAFLASGTYTVLWRHASLRDTLYVAFPLSAAAAVTFVLSWMTSKGISRAVLLLTGVLTVCLCCGARIAWRMLWKRRGNGRTDRNETPILIVGAGDAATAAIQMCAIASLGKPVALVDDDPKKRSLRIENVPVRGSLEDIPGLLEQYNIKEIIIAILTLKGDKLSQVVSAGNEAKCRIRMIAYLSDNGDDAERGTERLGLRELNIADFLCREEVRIDTEKVSGLLKDKTVLVTGGGGSIGSELCRQIMRFSPRLLLIFDIYENCAYELECELVQRYGLDCPVLVLVGSVQDKRRVDEVMDAYRPRVVFHAAAHKHVPLMETSPGEAVKNNVLGTYNVLQSANQHGVECFVSLSTDKAVNPTNVMGATKRITEMLVQYTAWRSTMKCMAVRFGNVLGSHGSVIPLFEAQIRGGGPLTVTHPDMERFFMTIPEAAQLVLQAGSLAHSGAIYMLDMGQPVRIMDLAEKLIRSYGYTPGIDIKIKVTGLRPGEKLTEELMTKSEADAMTQTEHGKIFAAPPIQMIHKEFSEQLEALFRAAERNDETVVEALARIVPTYRPKRLKQTG